MTRRINIHIDELKLVGLQSRDPYAIAASLRAELHRLVGLHGAPRPASAQIDRIHGPLSDWATGSSLGREAATTLYEGMTE